MRCIACGLELRSLAFEPAHAATAPGDEPCRFLCADCDRPLLAGPVHARASAEPEQTSSALAAPSGFAACDLAIAPALVPSDVGDDLDQCAALLKSAIQMVRGRAREPRPAACLAETPGLDGSLPVHSSPPMALAACAEADSELDECERLLRRAIALVRGPARRPRPTRRGGAGRVVQIRYDPQDAAYVATDAKSGLSVLRHRDRARLHAMCDRIGWQVIEDAALKAAE